MFISVEFIDTHSLVIKSANGTITGGGGKKIADRIGTVHVTVRNGEKLCRATVTS